MNRVVGIKALHQGTRRKISESMKLVYFNPKILINTEVRKTNFYNERACSYQNDF